jgi:autotransporter translocation and assembly factor TamB
MKLLMSISLLLASSAWADGLSFQFKSPSFSGAGQSAHYLTIDEQERSRKIAIQDEVEARLNELEREAENTTLAKFIRNLESRIFSQLSRDLAESLFNSEGGGTGGVIDLEGNQIAFVNTGTEIVLRVTDVDGAITEIRIPIGTFGICSAECGI